MSPAPPDDGSRQHFLRLMGGGAAAAGLAVLLAACGEKSEPEPAPTAAARSKPSTEGGGDVAILNYALTLEYVEAAYYEQAVASGVVKARRTLELMKAFGATEQEHADALASTIKRLGGRPVTAPKTAFEPVFRGGEEMVVQVAATVENVGAAAYLGQASAIQDKEILAAALAIHTVEARHAAAMNALARRTFKGGGNLEGTIPDGAFAKPLSMDEVLLQVKPFLTN